MDLFNTKVKDHEYPIRKITLSPTYNRARPFILYVGQKFDADGKKDALEISRIEYRLDMYNKTGDKIYDVYAVKNDSGVKMESRWKRFVNVSDVQLEYDQDF